MKVKAREVIEQTQQNIKRRWKFIEGKERPIVYIGMALAFILSVVFIFVIYNAICEKHTLQMKFDSEKSFNTVYMAMNDNPSKAASSMADEGVTALGVYSSSGQLFQRLGDAPDTLPISRLAQSRRAGQDSSMGIYIVDEEEEEIEYFRLSRLNVIMETGVLFAGSGNNPAAPIDFPDIIYVKFDGSEYFSNIRRARILTGFSIAAVLMVFLVVLSIYNNNRRYRIQLQKNESLAKLGAAARTLTHEIKNPLSAMTIQSALMRKMLPEEFKPDLDVMDHEITRLTNLTNRVSEFLKNPAGNPEDIELVSFIRDIARLFGKEISFDVEVPQVVVSFDPDRARSVFENLMKNAVESCEGRDPQVEVQIRIRHRNVVVKVMDRGDGLPKEMRAKLFDPFFTTKIHGSGIGLAISKQFVEARGGSLKLYDREGGGTVSEVTLPCRG
ncbi:MAG: HAMP domain-containing histidine kinase [Spirochaetales bacterium]|nr:HAMP domain-containing histidine kinase [Spirochaetales bacterium]